MNTSAPTKPPVPITAAPVANPQAANTPEKISSLTVLGEMRKDGYFYSSTNYLEVALKECVGSLIKQSKQSALNVVKGEKTSFEDAKKRAKKETDTHILWINLVMNATTVEFIDYAVLAPQTAKFVTTGRIDPAKLDVGITQGGVLQLPRSSRLPTRHQVEESARQIAYTLIRSGWL